MARTCNIPYRFIFQKAQGIKLHSLILRECIQSNYVFDKSRYSKEFIQGATVKDANTGFYNYPVTVFDFESLYPNCIITYNLSPDTFIDQQHDYSKEMVNKYGEHINEFQIRVVTKKNETYFDKNYKFIKPEFQQGIFPRILLKLLELRKSIKR